MKKIKNHLWQCVLTIDQAANVFLFFGWADETLSARCWRLHYSYKFWAVARRVVDAIFFFEKNHCWKAFLNEVHNRHKAAAEYTGG